MLLPPCSPPPFLSVSSFLVGAESFRPPAMKPPWLERVSLASEHWYVLSRPLAAQRHQSRLLSCSVATPLDAVAPVAAQVVVAVNSGHPAPSRWFPCMRAGTGYLLVPS